LELAVAVGSPGAFRLTVDVSKIELVAHAVGVDDVTVPGVWNGSVIEVHAAPVVVLRYHRGEDGFGLLQARQPELDTPASIDVAQLGALGLRLAGMSAGEARLFAQGGLTEQAARAHPDGRRKLPRGGGARRLGAPRDGARAREVGIHRNPADG
jgi:hypothetical protein